MSLFDLQDVCIAIGSLATLDLPMVVDLIVIYVLKGSYCTLITTNWFLPRARRPLLSTNLTQPPATSKRRRRRPTPPPAVGDRDRTFSISVTRRIRSCQNPSDILVHIDGGIVFPVMDLIRRSTAAYLLKFRFPCETGRGQAPRRQQAMAASLIHNAIQIYFDSVFSMAYEGMVQMFKALESSGLRGFLGCSSAIYEAALVDFYHNASVRDNKVISSIQGKSVEISEEQFAGIFELPTEGLTDVNEVPKDLVFDARSAFSVGGEQLKTSCKKKEMKFQF
ncbi:hypothetical protein F511_42600 [Dorcoceras hygrometricum]|uniref:Uncharacterized protein n=1 Tax=Dorcoceras hygrometricum TaxID=472368 RepID=A0A2Z7B1M2_9LAMI|nr:hypothetical protein F511_42600 [Dorcoceras hygrometricum]